MTVPRVTVAMLRKEAKRAGVDLWLDMFHDLSVAADTWCARVDDFPKGRAFLLAGLRSLPDAKRKAKR